MPLMVLAFFAVVGGWIGIPRSFPLLGAISSNPFHHFIGGLAEALHIEAAELPFSAVPLLTSLVVALGGLAAGWAVYRGFSQSGDRDRVDPMVPVLGRLYTLLQNKYYFDEIYYSRLCQGRPAPVGLALPL